MQMIRYIMALTSLCIAACAETPPIQPAASSESHFAGALYQGDFVTTGAGSPGADTFRVFVQGATGLVSIQSVRVEAEQRAKDFCGRRQQAMESLSETTARPPYIFGNFPRVEIVFDCATVPNVSTADAGDDPNYSKLVNLKKLLDGGILTQGEYDREKAKILDHQGQSP